jgi:hypothetical protein
VACLDGQERVFTSQILKNTFSPAYNLPATPSGFAEDTATNTAVMPTATGIETVDLTNGTLGSFPLVTNGSYTIAVDSAAGKAVVPGGFTGDNGIGIYNLATKSGKKVFPPGDQNYPFQFWVASAADPVNHLFLVADSTPYTPTAPHASTSTSPWDNNNAAQILVYNENGKLLKNILQFPLTGTWTSWSNELQLNPARRMGYLPFFSGFSGPQLIPFHY